MSEEESSGGYVTDWVPITDKLWGRGILIPGGAATVDQVVDGLELRGKRIFDFGSGIGGPAAKLARDHGVSVVGVELVPEFVEYSAQIAKEIGVSDKVEFHCVEPGPMPFEDSGFDLFFTSGVLCHIEDRESVLKEAFRLLKPGGVVTGYDWYVEKTTPVMTHWEEVAGFKMFPTTQAERLQLLQDIGFEETTGKDITDWYAPVVVEEIATLEGPYFEQAAKEASAEVRDHFIQEWKCMKAALDTGLVKQGIFRGRKPQ